MTTKVILIPGNGGCSPADAWYPWVERELSALGLEVINRQFPDSVKARAHVWLPFLETLGADAHTSSPTVGTSWTLSCPRWLTSYGGRLPGRSSVTN